MSGIILLGEWSKDTKGIFFLFLRLTMREVGSDVEGYISNWIRGISWKCRENQRHKADQKTDKYRAEIIVVVIRFWKPFQMRCIYKCVVWCKNIFTSKIVQLQLVRRWSVVSSFFSDSAVKYQSICFFFFLNSSFWKHKNVREKEKLCEFLSHKINVQAFSLARIFNSASSK